jgi:hypothetical protein
LHFPLLRSWQKPRFLPAETKLMSEKAPQATFSNELGAWFAPCWHPAVRLKFRAVSRFPAAIHQFEPQNGMAQRLKAGRAL